MSETLHPDCAVCAYWGEAAHTHRQESDSQLSRETQTSAEPRADSKDAAGPRGRMIRPGAQVVRPGVRGKGQVVRVDGSMCEVLWRQGRTQEQHSLSELAWVGLRVHTRDDRGGKVVALGKRGDVRVRLPEGRCCWMDAEELAPRVLEKENTR